MRNLKSNPSVIRTRLSKSFHLFVLAGALLASGPAGADLLSKPDPMQGYYFGIGAGGHGAVIHADKAEWIAPLAGPGGSLHIGQGITDNLALGIHVGAAYHFGSDYNAILGHFGIELKWRLFDNLFLRPAVGFGFQDVSRHKKGLVKVLPSVAGAYSIGVGYDFFVKTRQRGSGGLAVTPIVWTGAGNGTSLTAIQWGLGIELTFWTGLPKNQLDLPVEEAY